MISGLRLASYAEPIIVHDRSDERMRLLRREFRIAVEPDFACAVSHAQVIVLAVRPDAASEMLHHLDQALRQSNAAHSKTLVSVMAGLPLAWLRKRVTARVDWIRAMPSPLCESGNGLTALAYGRGCSPRARAMAKRLFAAFGQVLEISESHFDAFTVIYSPSHGVHALSALTNAGLQFRLPRRTALIAAAHALSAAQAAPQQKVNLERMVRQAATPGGTAEATMAGMDAAGYREAVAKGVKAGVARARSMARR